MAEFDEKLNRILSNPDAMAQIARLAQSLNGPPPDANAPPPGPPPMGNAPPGPPPAGNAPPGPPDGNAAPFAGIGNAPTPDANSIAPFLPLLQELGGDSDARRLLYALRPYLRPHKQEKVEQALRLARLFRVGKKFLSQWEG